MDRTLAELRRLFAVNDRCFLDWRRSGNRSNLPNSLAGSLLRLGRSRRANGASGRGRLGLDYGLRSLLGSRSGCRRLSCRGTRRGRSRLLCGRLSLDSGVRALKYLHFLNHTVSSSHSTH